MNTFKHNDIEITVTETGEFTAFVNGEKLRAGSLAAIKKQIDKKNEFKPFDAIACGEYGGAFKRATVVTVTGILKPRGKESWSNKKKWVTTERNVDCVYSLDSKEAIKRYVSEESRFDEAIGNLRKEKDLALAEILKSITRIEP